MHYRALLILTFIVSSVAFTQEEPPPPVQETPPPTQETTPPVKQGDPPAGQDPPAKAEASTTKQDAAVVPETPPATKVPAVDEPKPESPPKKKARPKKKPQPKRIAIAKLSDVDEDFAFQGEYSGLTLPDGSTAMRTVGLQVIARGAGKFDAVAHMGGLPGAGAGSETVELNGTREGETLELDGDTMKAVIAARQATLYSSAGNRIGSFFQVQRKSSTLGQAPPPNAIVLFDGTNTDEFKNGKVTEDGLLKEGTQLKRDFKDFTMHLEFRLAYMPNSLGQKRSNSGIYLHSRYEVQVLDSFGLEGAKNECGALYRYKEPDVNMCLPPLSWQTYDITFFSARFDTSENKYQNARLTVRHNGVLVHNNFEVERKTGAGKKEGPDLFPTKIQNHSDPVRFRNIWIVDHSGSSMVPPCNCPPVTSGTETPALNFATTESQ